MVYAMCKANLKKIIIFGNSASGKSTLAKKLSKQANAAHLDLDLFAWLPTTPPSRMPISESMHKIEDFMSSHQAWVIEGCYADLLEQIAPRASEMIFLNLPLSLCLQNAKSRPWEPHKYKTKEAQDANLAMLCEWIADYENRDDAFSKQSHQALFESFEGQKTMLVDNQ